MLGRGRWTEREREGEKERSVYKKTSRVGKSTTAALQAAPSGRHRPQMKLYKTIPLIIKLIFMALTSM